MEVYQCCYTHASHGNVAGWETVAVSPDAPQDAVRACTRIQNADSPQRPGIVDEQGNVLVLTELSGDGSCLYHIRTQYGLSDSLGRPSMFSHGYLFPLREDEILYDPNRFLTLSDENFKSSETDAKQWNGMLKYAEPLTLASAMEICGLDQPRLAILARCVYAQMSMERNPKPLYLVCDASRRYQTALLYCIYSVIPAYMRRTLKTASSANAVNLRKNLILSADAREKEYWLDPVSGENNLLTSRMERRIARYAYPDYAAANLPPEEIPDFFRALDQTAAAFGDPTASNELVLKLACAYLTHGGKTEYVLSGHPETAYTPSESTETECMPSESAETECISRHSETERTPSGFSNEELESNLSAAARCGTASETLERFTTVMLEEINRRELWLSKETESGLDRMPAKAEIFREAQNRYRLRKLYILPEEEAVQQLRKWKHLPRAALIETEQGIGLLKACQAMLEQEESARFVQAAETEGISALRNYAEELQETFPPDEYQRKLREAVNIFWKKVRFSNFAFDDYDSYERFRNDSRECRMFLVYGKLVRYTDQTGKLLQEIYNFLSGQILLSPGERRNAVNSLYVYLRRKYNEREDLLDWMIMAGSAETDELIKRIRLLCDASRTNFQPDRILEQYPKFQNACRHAKNTGYIQSRMPELLTDVCREHDSETAPVPLDLWLRLGENRGKNCFAILDEADAAVLKQNAFQVIRNSALMKQIAYREAAQIYIERQGGTSKTVRWLETGRTSTGETMPPKEEKKSFLSFLKR